MGGWDRKFSRINRGRCSEGGYRKWGTVGLWGTGRAPWWLNPGPLWSRMESGCDNGHVLCCHCAR